MLGQTLTVAIADPLNVFIMDDLRNVTGKEIEIVIASESQILRAIDQFYQFSLRAMAQAAECAGKDFEICSKAQTGGAGQVCGGSAGYPHR